MLKLYPRARSRMSSLLAPVFALAAASLGLIACVVEEGADPLDSTAETASPLEHAELGARPVVANAVDCMQYQGVVEYREEVQQKYNLCCDVTTYYDLFYNQCTNVHSEYYVRTDRSCYYGECMGG